MSTEPLPKPSPHDLSFPWGGKFFFPASPFLSAHYGPLEFPQLFHPSDVSMFPSSQAAEKEAALAQQEEEKAEQRKRARAEKKALKKKKKTRGADKRKAEEDDEKEWGDDEEGRAFWNCCLGTSLTSREVTGTIHRTFCLEPVENKLSAWCPITLPVPARCPHGRHLPSLFGLPQPTCPCPSSPWTQASCTTAYADTCLARLPVLPWWSFPSSASLAPAISGAGRCGAYVVTSGLFWQSPLR